MPAASHVCPKCSYEHPCFFTEGDIVSLAEGVSNEPALWTGIVLDIERDASGRVYRVLWGPPPERTTKGSAVTAKHSGAHRGRELQRFLVPLLPAQLELRGAGGGGREGLEHRFAPPAP
jgi:hypothetical protein